MDIRDVSIICVKQLHYFTQHVMRNLAIYIGRGIVLGITPSRCHLIADARRS